MTDNEEYHRGIRYLVRADRLGSIYPEEDECCPFFTPPGIRRVGSSVSKGLEMRKDNIRSGGNE